MAYLKRSGQNKMNDILYKLYSSARRIVDKLETERKKGESPAVLYLITSWNETILALEKRHPEFKRKYENNELYKNSLNIYQKQYICSQIGDWYEDWKDKMWIDEKPNQHWLGQAKEELKNKICGD